MSWSGAEGGDGSTRKEGECLARPSAGGYWAGWPQPRCGWGIDGALGLREFAKEMSVAEVIDEIRRLPAADLARVLTAVTNRTAELNRAPSAPSDSSQVVREASEEEFASAAERVFTEHRELLHRLAQ